ISAWHAFDARRQEARRRGKLRGIGLASVIEIAGGPFIQPAEEYAEIRFDPSGNVTLLTGTHSQGQGHETTFKQIVVTLLGVAADRVRVVFGDTGQIPYGRGTFGSRSATVVATALQRASEKIIAKGKIIAADLLETAVADIEFRGGCFTVV